MVDFRAWILLVKIFKKSKLSLVIYYVIDSVSTLLPFLDI